MTSVIFPITLVLSFAVVAHSAEPMLVIFYPAAVVLVASSLKSVDTTALADSDLVMALVNVAVGVARSG